jgi:hypothetical protein
VVFHSQKFKCARKTQNEEKKSLRRDRIRRFDDTFEQDLSGEECGSDCTSCEN